MAEYVAFSKAIVTEPLNYIVPGFTKDVHYLEFNNPGQCVDLCQQLLDDPERCLNMRHHNYSYYEEMLRPDMLIARTLELAGNGGAETVA